jgi:hypothetical protein
MRVLVRLYGKMNSIQYWLGVGYTLVVLPMLFFQVDPALLWYTRQTLITDLSWSRRFSGRAVPSAFILIPTMVLIAALTKE